MVCPGYTYGSRDERKPSQLGGEHGHQANERDGRLLDKDDRESRRAEVPSHPSWSLARVGRDTT